MWASVSKVQNDLAANVGVEVTATESPTSLQLSLENEALDAKIEGFVAAFDDAGRSDASIVGYVVAINGELSSADIYPSNGLFLKMWDKNLTASATEAVSLRTDEFGEIPDVKEARKFVEDGGADERVDEIGDVVLRTRESEKTYAFDTERAGGGWVHKNVLAK